LKLASTRSLFLAVLAVSIPLSPRAKADDDSPNLKISATAAPSRRQKLEEAIAAYKTATDHLQKEGYRAAKTELEAAVKTLRARCAEDAQDPLPLYYLGMLYQQLKDDKHAIENLSKVVTIAPKFHEAWAELGDAHAHLAEYEKAEQGYAHALELKPGFLDALRYRAMERMDAGRFQDAREDVKRGLEVAPKDPILTGLEQELSHAIEGPKWTISFTKETEHYIVKTDVDQPFADWISGQLELVRKLYVKVFEKTKVEQPKRKYTVIVFANADEYHKAGGPAMAGGHYDPRIRQLFLFKYPKPDDGQMVLFHEGFHQFLHPYLERAPQWFNEGLADYFGGAKHVKLPEEGMKIVPNWWRVPKVKEALNNGQLRAMRDIMLMSQAELYDPQTVQANYAESWSFIYFLCEYNNRQYFPLLARYFNALRAGKDQDEAYKAAFGDQDMKKIDAEWRDFVSKLD
jgi:tetratricopeptide (TPR) repeat protein